MELNKLDELVPDNESANLSVLEYLKFSCAYSQMLSLVYQVLVDSVLPSYIRSL